MKKLRIVTLSVITMVLSAGLFLSCNKDETPELLKEVATQNNEDLQLKKAYEIKEITRNFDLSNSKISNNSTEKSSSEFETLIKSQTLDAKKAVQIEWKKGEISYIVPIDKEGKKFLTITKKDMKKGLENINFSDVRMVEYNIDAKTGNGKITIISEGETIVRTFENGIISNDITAKTFRQCFDEAYDAICDGFIGCASWYSSPLPALTAVAYCGATT